MNAKRRKQLHVQNYHNVARVAALAVLLQRKLGGATI
jgi:hypothetical protein